MSIQNALLPGTDFVSHYICLCGILQLMGNLQPSECAMDHSVVMDLVSNFQAEFRILVRNCFCSWQRIEMLFGPLIRTDEAE